MNNRCRPIICGPFCLSLNGWRCPYRTTGGRQRWGLVHPGLLHGPNHGTRAVYGRGYPRPRNWSRFGSLSINGLSMRGWKDPNHQRKGSHNNKKKKKNTNQQHVRTIPGVLPHLDVHHTITPGLPVLREALRQLTAYISNRIVSQWWCYPGGSEAQVLREVCDEKQ